MNKDRIYTVSIRYPNSGLKDYFTVKVLGYDYKTDVKETINKEYGCKMIFHPWNPISYEPLENYLQNTVIK